MNSSQKLGTDPKNPTAQLAEQICAITFDDLDPATISVAKRLIADGIAVAAAGSREAPPAIVAEYVRDLACKPSATVWGFGFKTAPGYAALANGISMHVLDFEPMSSPSSHTVSPTVPVAFALAEGRQADGRDIITACVKGLEMQHRLLIAANPLRESLIFHSPGIFGVMGSAVTASHLLKLSSAQLTHALGIGASRCGGLSANSGTMVKSTHCGNAARAGIEAALLAARGFTANPDILSARKGYVWTFFSTHFDYDILFQFGRPFRCVDPGMAIKFYPSKYATHFGIASALEVRPAIGDPAEIRHIRIIAPEILNANRPQPRTGLEGKFSFQYTVAVALLDGFVGIDSFTDERRFRSDVTGLLEKTTVHYDKSLPRDSRNMHIELEVTLNDGTCHSRICRKPPGTWGMPMDQDGHRLKIRNCLGTRLKDPQIVRLLYLLDNLERLSAREIAEITALLA